jgi:hypothetical protein
MPASLCHSLVLSVFYCIDLYTFTSTTAIWLNSDFRRKKVDFKGKLKVSLKNGNSTDICAGCKAFL